MLRPEWSHAEEVIRIGAEWLRTGEQPADAVFTQFGYGTHAGGGLTINFAPDGARRRPYGPNTIGFGPKPGTVRPETLGAVVFLSIPDLVPGTYEPGVEETYANAEKNPPLTEQEVAALRSLLEANRLDITDSWNGAGLRTASWHIAARSVHGSLNLANSNYLDGCPQHGSVFCPEDCTWFDDGRAAAVPPVFPVVPYPAPPASPAPSDDDRNLDAVRRALRAITPILAEMGIHPATVVAGRRGHIDEHEDGSLEFVPDAGHGVLIPAETAERLVAAAWAAVEAEIDH